jgi:hypothetical protein
MERRFNLSTEEQMTREGVSLATFLAALQSRVGNACFHVLEILIVIETEIYGPSANE